MIQKLIKLITASRVEIRGLSYCSFPLLLWFNCLIFNCPFLKSHFSKTKLKNALCRKYFWVVGGWIEVKVCNFYYTFSNFFKKSYSKPQIFPQQIKSFFEYLSVLSVAAFLRVVVLLKKLCPLGVRLQKQQWWHFSSSLSLFLQFVFSKKFNFPGWKPHNFSGWKPHECACGNFFWNVFLFNQQQQRTLCLRVQSDPVIGGTCDFTARKWTL